MRFRRTFSVYFTSLCAYHWRNRLGYSESAEQPPIMKLRKEPAKWAMKRRGEG